MAPIITPENAEILWKQVKALTQTKQIDNADNLGERVAAAIGEQPSSRRSYGVSGPGLVVGLLGYPIAVLFRVDGGGIRLAMSVPSFPEAARESFLKRDYYSAIRAVDDAQARTRDSVGAVPR